MENVTKWKLAEDPILRRRMGKTGEELGELTSVVNRILIQGIDEIDPGTGKTNRRRLEEETADVLAQCERNIVELGLDKDAIAARIVKKGDLMIEWEQLYKPDWQERVRQELEQNKDRLAKLMLYLSTTAFSALPYADREDLSDQALHMKRYVAVLERRVARFA